MSEPWPDTADLRCGPPLHDDLLALLPLVGEWRGTGTGDDPQRGSFRFDVRLTIAHDGRDFLAHDARSWTLDDAGSVTGPGPRETGYWRPGVGPGARPDADAVELIIAQPAGRALVLAGRAGDQRWEIVAVSAAAGPGAEEIAGERRLYAVLGDELVYVTETATSDGSYRPHLNARLRRGTAAGRPAAG